jgi:general secretion pathway protein F
MKTFEYRGYDASGRRTKGLVEADGLKDARERLAARGVLPERLAPASAGGGGGASRWGRPDERAATYRELASLIHAGLPVTQGLDLLIDSPELAAIRPVLAGVRDRVREGVSPADAFEASGALTPFETAVLQAGQRAGALDDSMKRLAGFLEEQGRIRTRVRSALIYPAFVGVIALAIGIGMLGFMLPAFARIFEESRIPLPALTRFVLAAGRVAGTIGLPVLALGAAAVWTGRRRLRASAAARARVERALARLPVVRRAWTALAGMRFARTLALLLRGGVPLLDSMRMAGRATGSAWVEIEVDREAETVRHGGRLADAIRRVEPLQSTLPAWVQAGEAGGDLSGMLDMAAARCEEVWDRTLTRAMALLEPALILVLGALVFLLALAILLPILGLNQGLG